MADMSRRKFAAMAAGMAALPFATSERLSGADPITARELIERIRTNIGVEWRAESVDGVKAGDASAAVKGIVVTAMATIAVLQQAVKAGANIVITAQPTFYGRADSPTPPAGRGVSNLAAALPDPVFDGKRALISKNDLVVFRLSEHWRERRPDPFVQGLASALGWTKYQMPAEPRCFEMPPSRLDALASRVRQALGTRGGMRVVGERATMVRRVALVPGTTPIQAALSMLPHVDAIVAGEVREWESVEYVRDKVFSGERKALILVGRIVSEEPGMNVCAGWLRTFVSGVPIRHITAGDPYWRPAT